MELIFFIGMVLLIWLAWKVERLGKEIEVFRNRGGAWPSFKINLRLSGVLYKNKVISDKLELDMLSKTFGEELEVALHKNGIKDLYSSMFASLSYLQTEDLFIITNDSGTFLLPNSLSRTETIFSRELVKGKDRFDPALLEFEVVLRKPTMENPYLMLIFGFNDHSKGRFNREYLQIATLPVYKIGGQPLTQQEVKLSGFSIEEHTFDPHTNKFGEWDMAPTIIEFRNEDKGISVMKSL